MDYKQDGNLIIFDVEAGDDGLLEKLSFVYLVQMKFLGDEVDLASYKNEGNEPYIHVEISFDKKDHYYAFDHCKLQLDGLDRLDLRTRARLNRLIPADERPRI